MNFEDSARSHILQDQTGQGSIAREKRSIISDSSYGNFKSHAATNAQNGSVAEAAVPSSPFGHFITSTVLNVGGIAAAIAFGVYAVHSARPAAAANNLAGIANNQSEMNNQIALINLCLSNSGILRHAFCHEIEQNAAQVLSNVALILGLLDAAITPSMTDLFTPSTLSVSAEVCTSINLDLTSSKSPFHTPDPSKDPSEVGLPPRTSTVVFIPTPVGESSLPISPTLTISLPIPTSSSAQLSGSTQVTSVRLPFTSLAKSSTSSVLLTENLGNENTTIPTSFVLSPPARTTEIASTISSLTTEDFPNAPPDTSLSTSSGTDILTPPSSAVKTQLHRSPTNTPTAAPSGASTNTPTTATPSSQSTEGFSSGRLAEIAFAAIFGFVALSLIPFFIVRWRYKHYVRLDSSESSSERTTSRRSGEMNTLLDESEMI